VDVTDPREEDDEELRRQLTAAAWYLDRAVATEDAGARDRDVQQARGIHDRLGAIIARRSVNDARLRSWKEAVAVLKSRLEGFGEQF